MKIRKKVNKQYFPRRVEESGSESTLAQGKNGRPGNPDLPETVGNQLTCCG